MKCQFCNVEMVYKPNMRGLYSPGMDHNMNALIVNYTEEVEEDCLIFKIKRKKTHTIEINPKYYVCPKCGQIITKIPNEMIDDVIEAEK